jgi:hypothetical protein
MLLASALAVAMAITAQAQAQTGPAKLFPSRDVTVAYRVLGANSPQMPREVTIATLAAEGRLRLDARNLAGGMAAWGLTDRRTGRTELVMDTMRVVMPSPLRQEEVLKYIRLAETARLARAGNGSYAGHGCTNWRWEHEGRRGTICLTQDGVMLRGADDAGQGLEATRVDYAPQDPMRFRVPEGYRRVNVGDMARSLGLSLPRR